MSRSIRCLLVSALLLAPAVAFCAAAWWNDDWNFRKEIDLDLSPTGADIADTVTDAPVLVRLHVGNFSYFADTKADGSDLRFVAADDKTPLPFDIERYDPQAQMAFLWVRVPKLTGGAKTDKLHLYYGNASASAADSAGTFDRQQAVVYHFAEGPGHAPADATSNRNNAAASGVELTPASLIGGGARFNGAATLSAPASASLKLAAGQGGTLSAWVKFDAAQQRATVAALESDRGEFVLGIQGTQASARVSTAAGPVLLAQSGGELALNSWHLLTATVGAGKLQLFVDGVPAGSAVAEPLEIAGTLTLGGTARGTEFYRGEMDEFGFASTARSAAWIRAAFKSQGMEANLVALGADAQKDSGGVSYFAITLRNVTVDGWVVIVMLGVMFVGSVIVMIGKATALERVRRANAAFMTEFHRLRNEPGALDEKLPPEFDTSTLYKLYHHGAQELKKRMEAQAISADRARILSPQSIEAIRATMDATHTRMTQKLSAQMVLLTICISGGPFLGLLGTVVGVMITFAAIAASGDVNINAIAPGTAAALAATVAGLAVAIPCLFGYNFLNTRIREITADMRVFVDEFVTQVAESYS